ncbi:MAG TPA: SUMF1/EgtB/PvdO family nonheme iron enzyme [Polyangiaceae bacterium]|nr:SUMF1/EgtB/PvdO family nonheme iron enzyme [Polyangiaceae bacterium]
MAALSMLAALVGAACGGAEFGSPGAGGAGADAGGRAQAGTSSVAGKASSGGSAPVGGDDNGGSGGDNASGSGSQPSGGTSSAGAAGAMPGGGASGSGGSSGGGAPPVDECPCAAPKPTCEAGRCITRGALLIKAGSFYVDATEVTVEHYAKFLEAKGDDTSGQAAECAWNDSFEPSAKSDSPKHPVTHVDFCDATAYCAWADKQLCGKVGGGKLDFADLASPSKSQWFAACGGPMGRPYPYGVALNPNACNSLALGKGEPEDVGSFTSCDGFYDGGFDMVGNVAEWVNACDASSGSFDGCETIGGSYADNGTCSLSSLKHRNEQLPTVGFRCCSKPAE